MKKNPTDITLLESALTTIEQVLARADCDLQGPPYFGPTGNGWLDDPDPEQPSADSRFRGSAAQSAIHICLSSAAALVDVSQSLMQRSPGRTAAELEREWKTLVAYTKTASRAAYRAALILAAQKHAPAAQNLAPGDEQRRLAH